MALPVVPPEWISFLAIVGSILCVPTFRAVPSLARSSLIVVLQFGFIIFGPALGAFGILYGYFFLSGTLIDIRQAFVRLLLFYLFGGFNIWFAYILIWGKKL